MFVEKYVELYFLFLEYVFSVDEWKYLFFINIVVWLFLNIVVYNEILEILVM